MHIALLALLVFLPQEQLEAEVRRQEQQISRLEGEVRELERRNSALESALEEERQRPICSARISSTSAVADGGVIQGPDSQIQLTFFSTVSEPAGECLAAEIQVAASYVDDAGRLICSGVVRNIALQTAPTESINLNIRPRNLREFARWTNEPPRTNSGAQMLFCYRPDGQTEASPTEIPAPRAAANGS